MRSQAPRPFLVPSGALVALLAMGTAATVPAQMPARAILLSAQHSLGEPRIEQHHDVVNLFATTPTGATTLLQWRSADGGRTWPIQELALTALGASVVLGAVERALGHLVLLVGDPTTGPVLLRSSDDGATWAPPIPIAAAFVPQPDPVFCDLFVDGAVVVAAWRNDKPGGRVFANRSADGGLTWQAADVQLDVNSVTPMPSFVDDVRCFGTGAAVHVVWDGFTGQGGATFHQRSFDGGTTWRPTAVLTNMDHTRAAASAGNVVLIVTYPGEVRRSTDFGDTWATFAVPAVAGGRDVAASGNVMAVAGLTQANAYTINVSTDGGQTWLANPLQTPGQVFLEPHVHFGDDRLWVHFRGIAPYVGVLVSDDDGVSWRVVGGPVDAGFDASDRRTIHVGRTITVGGPRLLVYVGTGGTPLGAATPGTGGIAPALANVRLPLQGHPTTLQVDGAVGGSFGGLGISFAPPVPLTLGSAVVWPTIAPILLPLATSGAAGVAGAGSHARPIGVPIDPALVDASFTAQALIVDAGAGDGFTVTNALTVWLR